MAITGYGSSERDASRIEVNWVRDYIAVQFVDRESSMVRVALIIIASVAAAFAHGQEEPEMFMGRMAADRIRWMLDIGF